VFAGQLILYPKGALGLPPPAMAAAKQQQKRRQQQVAIHAVLLGAVGLSGIVLPRAWTWSTTQLQDTRASIGNRAQHARQQ
jgi:hypothetical protein